VFGGVSMHAPSALGRHVGAVTVALLGVVFFFAIVGVFGLPAAIISLVLFIGVALLMIRRPQGRTPP
jgi:hypothetical protein